MNDRKAKLSDELTKEDFKRICEESLDGSETFGDFIGKVVLAVYKLGIERGKMLKDEQSEG